MSPRQVTREESIDSGDLQPGGRDFTRARWDSRDEDLFENSDIQNTTRDAVRSLVVGSCSILGGGAVSRSFIAEGAVPMSFERFPDSRLLDGVESGGRAFRGPLTLPAPWGVGPVG